MNEQSVMLRNGELHAVHHQPDNDRREGVVFVHGWSGYCVGPHRMFVTAARRFAADGFHGLRLDVRGRGDSPGDKYATDLDGMIEDVRTACSYLRENGVNRVYVLGICSGGNVTLGAASLDKSIDGLVLWSTPLFAPHKARTEELRRTGFFLVTYIKKIFHRETWSKLFAGRLNLRLIAGILMGKGRGKPKTAKDGRNPKDSRRDVMSDLQGYSGRALFVYGSADDEAAGAPEFYKTWCEQNGVPATFHTVEGANHSYYSLDWEREVIETSAAWLVNAG